MALSQAMNMIKIRIELKKNQIKTRRHHIEAGKFETITDLIEVEIRNLQSDIEFLKALQIELE